MKRIVITTLAVAAFVFVSSPVAKADLPECTVSLNPNVSIPPDYSAACQPYDAPGGIHLNGIKIR